MDQTDGDKRVMWLKWLEVINETGKGLTVWEEEFIAGMNEVYRDDGMKLSGKQASILERIYSERTPT